MLKLAKELTRKLLSTRAALLTTIFLLTCGFVNSQNKEIQLDMSNPNLWTVDVVHLGSKQIDISFDSKDYAAVMLPKWSKEDANSSDIATRNIENGRLHVYQHIPMSDCSQSEITFEINIPQAYIDEGKMEFVFSLQAGAAGDYLFNGHTYKMSDFAGYGGKYKKMLVVPADFNEPSVKQRRQRHGIYSAMGRRSGSAGAHGRCYHLSVAWRSP